MQIFPVISWKLIAIFEFLCACAALGAAYHYHAEAEKNKNAQSTLFRLRTEMYSLARYLSYEFPPIDDVMRRLRALSFIFNGEEIEHDANTNNCQQFRESLRTKYNTSRKAYRKVK